MRVVAFLIKRFLSAGFVQCLFVMDKNGKENFLAFTPP